MGMLASSWRVLELVPGRGQEEDEGEVRPWIHDPAPAPSPEAVVAEGGSGGRGGKGGVARRAESISSSSMLKNPSSSISAQGGGGRIKLDMT